MLSKNHRIRKKKDIEKIFKEGKNFRENSLVLKTAKNDLNACRFGFIVSQKISKKANIRNKIKRRLREIVRAKKARFLLPSSLSLGRLRMKSPEANTDNLFIALPGLEKKEFKQLEETIEKLFKKAKINVQWIFNYWASEGSEDEEEIYLFDLFRWLKKQF